MKINGIQNSGWLSQKQLEALRKKLVRVQTESAEIVNKFKQLGQPEKAKEYQELSNIQAAYIRVELLYGDKKAYEKFAKNRIKYNTLLDEEINKKEQNVPNIRFNI